MRIGIDELTGMATGDVATLAGGRALRSYSTTDFVGLAAAMSQGHRQVVDARRDDERAQGHVRGSVHIPLHELFARVDEVPDGQVYIYCGSGYRASFAASVLDRPGREVVLVNDAYAHAAAALQAHPADADADSLA